MVGSWGCPIAIATPRRRAIRSVSASWRRMASWSASLSRNTSRSACGTPSSLRHRSPTTVFEVVRQSTNSSPRALSSLHHRRPCLSRSAVSALPMWLLTPTIAAEAAQPGHARRAGTRSGRARPAARPAPARRAPIGSIGRCSISSWPAARAASACSARPLGIGQERERQRRLELVQRGGVVRFSPRSSIITAISGRSSQERRRDRVARARSASARRDRPARRRAGPGRQSAARTRPAARSRSRWSLTCPARRAHAGRGPDPRSGPYLALRPEPRSPASSWRSERAGPAISASCGSDRPCTSPLAETALLASVTRTRPSRTASSPAPDKDSPATCRLRCHSP